MKIEEYQDEQPLHDSSYLCTNFDVALLSYLTSPNVEVQGS